MEADLKWPVSRRSPAGTVFAYCHAYADGTLKIEHMDPGPTGITARISVDDWLAWEVAT